MPPRPSREEALVATAFTWAERSTCSRLHVGCVLHRNGRILVQGYNGAPAGLPHCDHHCTCSPERLQVTREHFRECPTVTPCTMAVHAEQNAISYAARWGVELEGSVLVVTHQPCLSCAMSIINAGIIRVIYVMEYRRQEGVELLAQAGVEVEQFLDWEEPRVIDSAP